ncbi:TetR/AcrR family transcriptional regulator [Microbacterium sp. CIAB417]|uniref:TetR/AcrR family transcriptional regulator n=1 Tax=Microbacterium sp. CIAB417 TaxID=2860287 RepID=UPI001FABDB7B|nr:TetR/AcrR family transcriptional regulator [Microbacterium sp. CIAB417]
MTQRGSYAKGVARREQILEVALAVIAREGYRAASVREIADAVGLSQAGLLHYFDSKEHLFVEILRKRDELDLRTYHPEGAEDLPAAYERMIAHNAQVPGLVHLFARMSVEAGDPAHPAHAYFAERTSGFLDGLRDWFQEAAETGRMTPDMSPATASRLVQASWDGAQLQWLLDPSVDMAAIVRAAFRSALTGHQAQLR